MANVIRHAYGNAPGRPIVFEAHLSADGLALTMTLRDWGNGQIPQKQRRREYVPGEPGGLGLVCLKQMMDDIQYAPQSDGGMMLTMVRRRR